MQFTVTTSRPKDLHVHINSEPKHTGKSRNCSPPLSPTKRFAVKAPDSEIPALVLVLTMQQDTSDKQAKHLGQVLSKTT